jgi:hypothetical protein
MLCRPSSRCAAVGAIAIAAAFAAACGDTTKPETPQPTAMSIVSGANQAVEVGAELPDPIAVQVTDAGGRVLSGVSVTFEVNPAPAPTFSRGAVHATSTETDADGIARARWTLGTWAGVQTLRVRLGSAESSAALELEVYATAQPGVAVSIAPASEALVAITVGDSARLAVFGVDRHGNETSSFSNLEWRLADPALAFVSRMETRRETPPERSAVIVARGGGATVVEALDATAGVVRFDLRTYIGPGRDIAFNLGDGISLLSADGTTITALRQNASDPAWSPDGQQIAFMERSQGASAGAYVMNADGSGARALAAGREPSWSPDGRKLAFVGAIQVRLPGGVIENRSAVLVANLDGSEAIRVADVPCPVGTCFADRPMWSPDGARIAFASRTITCVRAFHGSISVVSANLTPTPIGPPEPRYWSFVSVGFASEPAWSPDGTRVVFQSSRDVRSGPGCQQPGPSDLYVGIIDGTGPTRLTHVGATQASSAYPAWSPDSRIAFFGGGEFGAGLFVMNGGGTEVRRVASLTGKASRPAWRPTPP